MSTPAPQPGSDTDRVQAVARLLDHAVLHPTQGAKATREECGMAAGYGIAAVCVKPCYVREAVQALGGSRVSPCSVVAFPHGNATPAIKAREAGEALEEGALEIDMVLNNGLVTDQEWGALALEVRAVRAVCGGFGACLKVIFEIDFLTRAQIETISRVVSEEGVDFLKTSTGFGFVRQESGAFSTRGATVEAVRWMRAVAPAAVAIKASGGIRTLDQVLEFERLGCTRIGVSATAAIMAEAQRRFQFSGQKEAPSRTSGDGASGY